MDHRRTDHATAASRRLKRELRTLRLMVGLHCRDRHGGRAGLCPQCEPVWDYARLRVENCRFCDDKPTCANCPVHCFKPAVRERVREAMRYAGPRMLWRHPLLAILHLLDGRRPAPHWPKFRDGESTGAVD